MPGAHDVGLDSLTWVALQKREVLVCGRVEHDLEPQVLEELLDPVAVPDVRDQQLIAVEQGLAVELHLKPVQV